MQISSPLISIIIPIFNSEDYLVKCLDSIKNQTYQSLEIICIDDGSTDSSKEIITQFQHTDTRIKLIARTHQGVSSARNMGLINATGEFCTFVDADDWLEPNAIELLLSASPSLAYDLVIGGYSRNQMNAYGNRKLPVSCFDSDREISEQELKLYLSAYAATPNRFPLFVTCWGRLIRRSMMQEMTLPFNENLSTFEDVDFNFRLLALNPNIKYIHTPIYNYREDTSLVTASHSAFWGPEKLFGFLTALDSLEGLFNARGHSETLTRRMVNHTRCAYTSITIVRLCRQINDSNNKQIKQFLNKLLNEPWLKESLSDYNIKKAHGSILIKILMWLRLTVPLMFIAQLKANKRYGKLPPSKI